MVGLRDYKLFDFLDSARMCNPVAVPTLVQEHANKRIGRFDELPVDGGLRSANFRRAVRFPSEPAGGLRPHRLHEDRPFVDRNNDGIPLFGQV